MQLRFIYSTSATSDRYKLPMLLVIHIFSPIISVGVAVAAWTSAFFWFYVAILGDPTKTDRRSDGKVTVLAVRAWWERWLRRGLQWFATPPNIFLLYVLIPPFFGNVYLQTEGRRQLEGLAFFSYCLVSNYFGKLFTEMARESKGFFWHGVHKLRRFLLLQQLVSCLFGQDILMGTCLDFERTCVRYHGGHSEYES